MVSIAINYSGWPGEQESRGLFYRDGMIENPLGSSHILQSN
jgi:hypothetical protein